MYKRLARLLIFVCMAVLIGCGSPGQIQQGNGLPTLHHLNWGYNALFNASWSPNGKWIVALAGDDFAGAYWEIISPDGTFHQSLRSWDCGLNFMVSVSWLSNSSLSCFSGQSLLISSYPFTTQHQIKLTNKIVPNNAGGVWSQDNSYLLVTTSIDPNAPTMGLDNYALYLIQANGEVNPTPVSQEAELPAWRPRTMQLTFIQGGNLVMYTVTNNAHGITLDAPISLASDQSADASGYAWSPSGTWVAVRYTNYRGGDKIYLVNADHPAQTVDVVLADHAGQQFTDPIWSPDGKTLIVFGVSDSQPYAIDIASFLKSKGLSV
jgi:Tol biopolymer transport system component